MVAALRVGSYVFILFWDKLEFFHALLTILESYFSCKERVIPLLSNRSLSRLVRKFSPSSTQSLGWFSQSGYGSSGAYGCVVCVGVMEVGAAVTVVGGVGSVCARIIGNSRLVEVDGRGLDI